MRIKSIQCFVIGSSKTKQKGCPFDRFDVVYGIGSTIFNKWKRPKSFSTPFKIPKLFDFPLLACVRTKIGVDWIYFLCLWFIAFNFLRKRENSNFLTDRILSHWCICRNCIINRFSNFILTLNSLLNMICIYADSNVCWYYYI